MAKEKRPFVGEFKELLEDFIQHKKSLALYLQSRGYEAYMPIKNRKVRRTEYIPYIFTHEEIDRFFQAVDSILPHSRSNKHHCFPLLYRLLYCCGLRISEACRLKISDVDFNSGILFIRGSKFNKDRLVPISGSLASMFIKYHDLFNQNNRTDDYYFRNKAGTPLKRDHVYKNYRKLLWKAGISHGGKGKGPRLHDFRKTQNGTDAPVTVKRQPVFVRGQHQKHIKRQFIMGQRL